MRERRRGEGHSPMLRLLWPTSPLSFELNSLTAALLAIMMTLESCSAMVMGVGSALIRFSKAACVKVA